MRLALRPENGTQSPEGPQDGRDGVNLANSVAARTGGNRDVSKIDSHRGRRALLGDIVSSLRADGVGTTPDGHASRAQVDRRALTSLQWAARGHRGTDER